MFCNAELWGLKCWGPGSFSGQHLGGLLEHFGNSKVDNLENVVIGEEEIVRLDISVCNALGMNLDLLVTVKWRWGNLTVFDAQNQIPEPASATFDIIRLRPVIEVNFHDDTLLAHFQDHVQRILLWIIQNFY